MESYLPIIGLEIHVEQKTKSKMFCQCSADYFGKKANSHVCPVCLGMPGALPVPNKRAIENVILLGKALNGTINTVSKFDRKHYFYPDLAKGYQISQYDEPIVSGGYLDIQEKRFNITRVHLEEDTGKLIHEAEDTLIDFNRSGVPLIEIVTEPVFHNSEDVKVFLEELQVIIRYLGISDADMEKGSMRLEPNISLTKVPSTKYQVPNKLQLPNYKVEVKNINSFRFVKQAIEYEIKRQTDLLKKGVTPKQETRGFDDKKVITYSQRSKEDAQDYRYFPEPDIPPMYFEETYLNNIFKQMPELPYQKVARYIDDFKIKEADAFIITRDYRLAKYFETVVSKFKHQMLNSQEKSCLPAGRLNNKIQNFEQTIANLIINRKISANIPINEFIKKALELITPKKTDEKLLTITITKILEANEKAVDEFKKGKRNAIMFLVGQVMREMKGQADANMVREQLIKNIK